LQARLDADQAKARAQLVQDIDPHRADHLLAKDQNMRVTAGLGFTRMRRVIAFARKVEREDRITPDGTIGRPILGGSHPAQDILRFSGMHWPLAVCA
jgi:hypothetical protein